MCDVVLAWHSVTQVGLLDAMPGKACCGHNGCVMQYMFGNFYFT